MLPIPELVPTVLLQALDLLAQAAVGHVADLVVAALIAMIVTWRRGDEYVGPAPSDGRTEQARPDRSPGR